MNFWTIFSAVVGGGALLSFIQFLINRHDAKSGKYAGITSALSEIKKDVDALRADIDRDRATDARIRILSFSDEILHSVRHSKESFDQVNSDIDAYRKYCDRNPQFKNNKAVMAIANIERVYESCLERNDFLS